MYAEQATFGNEYMVSRYSRGGRPKEKGTCLGWNHTHTKLIFTVVNEAGQRIAVLIDPKELIQTVD